MTATDFRALVAAYTPPPPPPSKPGERGGTVVVTRIRPAEDTEEDPYAVFARNETTVDLHELKTSVRGAARLQSANFTLDAAYGPQATTEQLYEQHIRKLVPWAWNGGVGTVFAYGQTGSGKTYTVSAIERLVAHELFSGVEGERRVYLSIVELAGNAACGELTTTLAHVLTLQTCSTRAARCRSSRTRLA